MTIRLKSVFKTKNKTLKFRTKTLKIASQDNVETNTGVLRRSIVRYRPLLSVGVVPVVVTDSVCRAGQSR